MILIGFRTLEYIFFLGIFFFSINEKILSLAIIHFQTCNAYSKIQLIRVTLKWDMLVEYTCVLLFDLFVMGFSSCPTGEFFTHRDTSPWPVKGCKFWRMLGTYKKTANRWRTHKFKFIVRIYHKLYSILLYHWCSLISHCS